MFKSSPTTCTGICSLLRPTGDFRGQDLLTDQGQPVFKNGTRIRILNKKDLAKLSKKVGWTAERLLEECLVVPYADTDRYRIIGCDIAAFLSVKCCVEMFAPLWTAENLRMCMAMMQAAYREDDRALLAVITGTLSDKEVLLMLKELAKKRLSPKGEMTTLYRTDALDTVLLHEWSLKHCQKFLTHTLGEAITAVCRLPLAFEADSSKSLSPMLVSGAQQNIMAVCGGIVEALGTAQLPAMLRAFLHQVYTGAKSKEGPDDSCSTIMVLRVLTPALLNPQKFGLVPIKLHKVQTRGLLLVAKVMQQIANGVAYDKSSVLFGLNEFIIDQHKILRGTIQSFSQPNPPQVSSECSGRLSALQKVLAHWPKYRKLTTMNLGLAGADPAKVDQSDDDVARFVIRFSSEACAAPKARPGMELSARPTKKKLSSAGMNSTPSPSPSRSQMKRKQRSDPGTMVRQKSKDRIDRSFDSETEISLKQPSGSQSQETEGSTFSSEVNSSSVDDASTSEMDDPPVALANALQTAQQILLRMPSSADKEAMDEVLGKIYEIQKAMEFAKF